MKVLGVRLADLGEHEGGKLSLLHICQRLGEIKKVRCDLIKIFFLTLDTLQCSLVVIVVMTFIWIVKKVVLG